MYLRSGIVLLRGPHYDMIIRTLQMMFKAINKPAKFVYVPTEIFDFSISIIEFIAKTWPSQKWEDVLETSKIGKYYAVEVSLNPFGMIIYMLSSHKALLSLTLILAFANILTGYAYY